MFARQTGKTGSSPRVRGTQNKRFFARVYARIIPARAGNTIAASQPLHKIADHPRACGEHWVALALVRRNNGSSPRVRGTLPQVGQLTIAERIIPACAGNMCLGSRNVVDKTDHPRACGEHRSSCSARTNRDGSSPRVRGTRAEDGTTVCGIRIIPARAGNTRKSFAH